MLHNSLRQHTQPGSWLFQAALKIQNKTWWRWDWTQRSAALEAEGFLCSGNEMCSSGLKIQDQIQSQNQHRKEPRGWAVKQSRGPDRVNWRDFLILTPVPGGPGGPGGPCRGKTNKWGKQIRGLHDSSPWFLCLSVQNKTKAWNSLTDFRMTGLVLEDCFTHIKNVIFVENHPSFDYKPKSLSHWTHIHTHTFAIFLQQHVNLTEVCCHSIFFFHSAAGKPSVLF